MDDTRVDADDVVEKILQSQDFTPSLLDSSAEGSIYYKKGWHAEGWVFGQVFSSLLEAFKL